MKPGDLVLILKQSIFHKFNYIGRIGKVSYYNEEHDSLSVDIDVFDGTEYVGMSLFFFNEQVIKIG